MHRAPHYKRALRGAIVSLALLVGGCAASTDTATVTDERDPWERYNRKIFAFNETADKYVAKPTAEAYDKFTPRFLQEGVGNMFDNARELINLFNDILQLKLSHAAVDSGRFLINSSIGVLGFFEVAAHVGLPERNEDFGQTLGRWGVGNGPYLVLPILGPSTVRDASAIPVDSVPDLVTYVGHVETRNQLRVWRLIDQRAALLGSEGLISGDRYTFMRDAYLQRREYLVNDGKPVDDSFGEEDFQEFEDW